ncbi:hypothetical protein LXL04_030934 [Taraxacum kok-saghyz]
MKLTGVPLMEVVAVAMAEYTAKLVQLVSVLGSVRPGFRFGASWNPSPFHLPPVFHHFGTSRGSNPPLPGKPHNWVKPGYITPVGIEPLTSRKKPRGVAHLIWRSLVEDVFGGKRRLRINLTKTGRSGSHYSFYRLNQEKGCAKVEEATGVAPPLDFAAGKVCRWSPPYRPLRQRAEA